MGSVTGRFVKKPVEVEAMRVPVLVESGAADLVDDYFVQWGRLVGWINSHGGKFHVSTNRGKGNGLYIETLEGSMHAEPGDWIIRGVAGEFYPCRADIFAQTYDPVGE